MKKSKSILIVSLAFFVVFASSMLGYIFGANADSGQKYIPPQKNNELQKTLNTEKKAEKEVIAKPEPVTKKYILREYNGKVVLVLKSADKSEKIHKSYDISVSLLPESDRALLKEGIEVESLSEALQLIEDYL